MDESSAKTSAELQPDQPESVDSTESRDSSEFPTSSETEAAARERGNVPDDLASTPSEAEEERPLEDAPDELAASPPEELASPSSEEKEELKPEGSSGGSVSPPSETEAVAVEFKQAPTRLGRRKMLLAAALVILMGLAALAWFTVPAGQDKVIDRETAELANYLAPVIRAENLDQDRLVRVEQELGRRSPQNRASLELTLGAAAFLRDELQEAHQHLATAAVLAPEIPELVSFQAAVSLRQGNFALAVDLYRRALTLKEQAARPPLDLAADQLGLALSLFFLQKPAEALPLAENAWLTRSRELGEDSPDTLSAANRLATIQVALGQHEVAEELLKAAYRGALAGEEVDAALEETRLLLTVLYNQSGRLEELEDFFRQDQPPEAALAKAGPNGESEEETRPDDVTDSPPPLPPATAENLAEWEKTVAGLDRSSPELAADLWLRIIQGREVRRGRDRHQSEFRQDLLALVQAYLAAGRYDKALEELRPLEETIGRDSDDFIQYSDLLGQSLAGRNNFKEAEAQWQAAVDQLDERITAQVRAKKVPAPEDVAHSLDLYLKLADLFLKQGRVPQEAEIELKAALGRLDRLGLQAGDYPDTARIYLHLARLMWETGQLRESAVFYSRAQKLAEDLSPKAEPARKELLANIARLAALEAGALAAKQSRPVFPSETAPATEGLPSPDILRLELSALAALGRRAEFQDRLEPVLQEAAKRYGQSSQYYMRYYSLKLKGLEEDGRIDDLTAELLRQAEQPPGRNEAEQALNRGSALIYAARVNEKAGRPAEAVKLYEQALEAISGREEDIIAARRRVVEEALERLKRK